MEGNQMKMREALEDSQSLLESFSYGEYGAQVREQMRDNRAALSAPPRNCDVGTAEEQAERMRLYCNSHGVDESGCFRCKGCPLLTADICKLAWSQMPYEEKEGEKHE